MSRPKRESSRWRPKAGRHDLNEDEFAGLTHDQPRSSARVIRQSLASMASSVTLNWINPGPVNPHVQIGGQYTGVSGKLQAFAWEPSHPLIMYAGGGIGSGNEGPATEAGVFKTTDGGNTWTAENQGLLDTTVNVLWIDQSQPNTLLAGTEFGGLFRSANGAASWTQVLPDASVSAIVSVTGGIIAGTGAGFEFSNDDGVTWTVLQATSSGVRCMAVNGSDIIAGLDAGDVLWKSASDSIWRTVASNPQLTVWDVAIDPADPTIAYYARGFGGTSNLVFRTMDRGVTWQIIDAPTSKNGGFSQTLAVRPSDRAFLVAGQSMLYESLDFGVTWTRLNCPWDSRKIFLLPGSHSMVIGSDHGFHWSDDGGNTWRDLTAAVSANILFSVAVSGQTILTSSQDFGPFVSSDWGQTWSTPTGPLAEGGSVAVNPGDATHCYAFTNLNFAVSVDGCLTFQAVTGPTWQNYVSAANQNLITIDPHNSANVYVGASNGVWLSSDWGLTLRRLSWPITQVSNVVLDPQDPAAIYVCATGGFYQSLDGGVTWTRLSLPTPSSPFAATVSPTDKNVILVALSNGAGRQQGGVLRSVDRGLTFDFVNQGLSTANYNLGVDQQSIAFNPVPPEGTIPIVALATTGGIYASADLGSTWQSIRANAIPNVFSSVRWDRGYLWATTYGQGILRSDQPLSMGSFSSPLEVTGGPVWFTAAIGISSTGSHTLQVTTVGSTQSFLVSANQGIGSCGNWLSASPAAGTTTGTSSGFPVTLSYDVTGLPPYTTATCNGGVSVTTGGSHGSTVTIPVTLVISPLQSLTIKLSTAGQVVPFAAESIVSAYGPNLATGTASAVTLPVPTSLDGNSVTVTDSGGVARLAPLFYVSPVQINFEIPAGTATGKAAVTIHNQDGSTQVATVSIGNVSPGLYLLNGAGLVAGWVLPVIAGEQQPLLPVYQIVSGSVVPLPISLGTSTQEVYLEMYGTGIRNAKTVTASVGDADVQVLYAGAAPDYDGEDQVNIGPLPAALAGRGNVSIILTADGQTANTVNVTIQ